MQWLRKIEAIALLVAIVALGSDAWYRYAVEYPKNRAEGRARAWDLLTRPVPGNSGKLEAIDYLARLGEPLIEVDLGCKLNTALGRCMSIYLDGLDVSPENIGKSVIMDATNFSGNYMETVNFSEARMVGTLFNGTFLKDVKLYRRHSYKCRVPSCKSGDS